MSIIFRILLERSHKISRIGTNNITLAILESLNNKNLIHKREAISIYLNNLQNKNLLK